MIVGCGKSADIIGPDAHTRLPFIGVNDSERITPVKYLLFCDNPRRFGAGRWKYIQNSQADYVFHYIKLTNGYQHPRSIPYTLDRGRAVLKFPQNGVLLHDMDSPWIAISLALWMGFTEIGLIGVDHTGNHPKIGKAAPRIQGKYAALADFLKSNNVRLVKLSEQSALPIECVPFEEWVNGN